MDLTQTKTRKAAAAIVLMSLGILSRSMAGAESVDFETQIQPVFAAHCLKCHGPERQRSGLRLDRRASLLRGGDFGVPTVVPGKPEESLLIAMLRGDDPDVRMPPEGDALEAAQIELISRWISEGAGWSNSEGAEGPPERHWAFQPVVRPGVPAATEEWPANPIDNFILRKLRAKGLEPSVDAHPATLIRRVTLDLTGLPPTPAEVDAFVKHSGDRRAAYNRLIDRLLNSPRYGERWAQHWLDVIRWAETVGFETNLARPNAWPYRDWVISAFNEDLPYDRFIFEQLAGDTVAQDAALGFLVAGPANLPGQIGRDEEAMRQARQDELDEVIRTVSQSVFGITIGCARCHNHKFDPILQRDYYAMQSVFAGLAYGDRRLRGTQNDKWTRQVPATRQRLQNLRADLETRRRALGLKPAVNNVQTEIFDPIRATSVRMMIAATGSGGAASLYEFEVWTVAQTDSTSRNVALASNGGRPSASSFALENQTRHHDNLVDGTVDKRQAFPWVAAKPGPAWIQIDFPQPARIDRIVWHRGRTTPAEYRIEAKLDAAGAWRLVADARDRLLRPDDARQAKQVSLAGISVQATAELVDLVTAIRQTESELTRLSSGPQVYAASFSSPGPTWLLRRGDPMQRGPQVAPSAPSFLGGEPLEPDVPEPKRRLELVKHLTRSAHPLTARVIVNRLWQHHFGAGLVDTPSDFGRMGETPSHPELLDWLATALVEGGWSRKRIHRLIVNSRTYRQASRPRPDAARVDGDTRLLWRFPPRRLTAEAIRDSILQVSGSLNLKMGGAGFDFFEQRGGLSDYKSKETFESDGWRRMVYAHKIRMQAVDIFGAFDCPDAGQMKPKRTRSITPIQSLSLLNSPFANRQAKFFADRVRLEVGDDLEAQVERAFQLALGRSPSSRELAKVVELLTQHGLEQACRVLLNTGEFVFMR